ncbi:OmpA family protein [Sunxiuqinia sp. sy24]|uniref:OmpA family protein n=1 Tax=Sunxiuqinia sp. sy24 TaxID=3461495 RepID=UPI0040465C5D
MKAKHILVVIFLLITFSGWAQKSLFDAVNMTIDTLAINTPYSDFGPAIIEDELVFLSFSEKDGKKSDKPNKVFYDLYSTKLNAFGEAMGDRTRMNTVVSKYHEGPLTYCKNTGELFLTQSNWENPQEENMVFIKKNIRLGIVIYEKSGSRWSVKEKLPFNSSEYSVAHPTISVTGDTLIFVSDMPGGSGETDLYYTVRTADGWADPINLGPKVNSSGKEMFPFLNTDGSLVFSSDGLGGAGKLDLFYIEFPIRASSQRSTFAGEVNSPEDDFGMVVHPNQQGGYFASNRSGGQGSDDVYFLRFEDYVFDVIAMSSKTKEILPGTHVNIIDEEGRVAASGSTNDEGRLEVQLEGNTKYTLVATNEEYMEKILDLDMADKTGFVDGNLEVYLDPEFVFKGQVVDIMGNVPIPDALLMVSDGTKLDSILTDDKGTFTYNLESDKKYRVDVSAYNYFGTEIEFNTMGMDMGVFDYLIQLYSLDAGSRIALKNIYYDFGEWSLRPEAKRELDRLAKVLEEYPDIQIILESHTDSRGTDEFNMDLSNKRSETAADYIISKGISARRLEWVGFGETQLVNECDGSIPCTEEQHYENRRTVVEIRKSKVTRRAKGNIFYF